MNIILEGIDKAGKSTVVADLREYLFADSVYVKLTQKPADDSFFERDMVVRIYQELFGQTRWPMNRDLTYLFDRSFPSEMVYSWKRGYDALSDERLLALDSQLAEEGNTKLIYCYADADTIAKRFATDKEEYLITDDITRTLERYEIFLQKTKLPFIKVSSLDSREGNLEKVKEFLQI